MAAPDFTGDEQQKTFEDLLCSPDLTAGLHGHLIFVSALNSFMSVTTFLGNALILIALHKESSLYPPSKLLLRCLATTDLCVGLIAEPLVVTYCISVVNEQWNTCPQPTSGNFYNRLYFVSSVGRNCDCNKRGQTSRTVVGTEIQTSCNFNSSLRDRFYLMAFARCLFNNVLLESPYNLMV